MTTASEVSALHKAAMELASRAFHADNHGDFTSAESLFREAFENERKAALLLIHETTAEPTRSVLLRSAASLAIDCREFREAERLVAVGLSGSPPTEIADELRDVLEAVYFSRHLGLRGLELDPTEFQMSLFGGAIGFGVVESGQFLRRAETLDRLLVRTIERIRGVPFREKGSPSQEALNGFEVFLSTPRAASFAITVKLGRPQRQLLLNLPDFKGPSDVVDEILTCIKYFNAEQPDSIRELIPSEAYFNNFTALAKKLAPDGEKVKTVGFTSVRGDDVQTVALNHPPGTIWRPRAEDGRIVELVGQIHSADETSKHKARPVFGVEEENGKTHVISVAPGLLQDIVKPYWGETVRVVAIEKKRPKRLELIEIEQERAERANPSDS